MNREQVERLLSKPRRNMDDVREERIKMVADYIITTGSSTRKTAEYFTKNHFSISNATVHSYCERYAKIDKKRYEQLRKNINKNKDKNVKDKDIEFRVYNHTKLLLSGMTLSEIEKLSGSSYWTIQRDVTVRLDTLDKDLANKVRKVLESRKRDNLRNKKSR